MLLLLSPVFVILLGLRVLKGKSREGWKERWGHISQAVEQKTGQRIWLHGASVGEVMAGTPILEEIKRRAPECDIVISVITPGGYEVARNLVGKSISAVVYAPFDIPIAVRRALRVIDPDLLLVMETEIWPNLLAIARRHGARIMLANGRISDRSSGRYVKLKWLFRWALGQFDSIMAQTNTDRSRLIEIGANPENVLTAGNAKFDQAADRLTECETKALRLSLRIPAGRPVLVVGSTRTADEEREIVKAYLLARESIPGLVLIHAPRHVERAQEVAENMRQAGLAPVLRTEMDTHTGEADQIVLNTFGELARVYAVGDVAYIGNSMLPPGGGQNLLQPLAQGLPVIYGPHMANFRDLAAMAKANGVGYRVSNATELAQEIVRLIQDNDGRLQIAEKAVALIQANRGAASRYAAEAIRLLSTVRVAEIFV